MSKVESEIDDAPGYEDIGNRFPPSSSASPFPISNVAMKLPAFWPDATEVWFTQADAQFLIRNISMSKTKFYPAVAVRRSLQGSQRTIDNILHTEPLSAFPGSDISSSPRKPETLAPAEQDVSSPSRRL